jgi:alkylation response protein AidB-like acyl-CoA dehydrogenase
MSGLVHREDHLIFRETVRRFVADRIVPFHAAWEEEGRVPRSLWAEAGAAGLLCPAVPEAWGGGGGDFLHGAIVCDEVARAGATGPLFYLHSDIVAPYLVHYGTDDQRRRFLPAMAAGRTIGALAMTEPGTGSDLRSIQTRARADGDDLVVTGQKIFISNGQIADLFLVAVKTAAARDDGAISMLLVEADRPGFRRGRALRKIGMKAQDTSEIFLDEVRVPRANLLGAEGRGFEYMMAQLPQERLLVAIAAAAAAEAALDWTAEYVRQRTAFGQPLSSFQNTRFEIADMATEARVGRVFVDHCIARHLDGALDGETASMAKLWLTEMQGRVIDRGLQLFGGYGYMLEYPIARAYADARVQRIYGGTSEIMKEIVARGILGGSKPRRPSGGTGGGA